jgi:CTP:molybdopterin cytidylyltransferase MocA/REP element-mobilizing transposase RayT
MNVAIILAAGESRRMGQPKQLLPFAGKTMLECVIDAFRSPRVDEIRVVLGYRAEEIAEKIGSQAGTHSAGSGQAPVPPEIRTIKNLRYQQGMFASMQAGLRDLPKKTKIVMIAVCDQPRLKRETVEALIEKFKKERHKILIPSYNGRQGHPPLLRAVYAKEILAMDESMTLKHFYGKHADDITRLVVEDEGVLIDIDDRETYERELEKTIHSTPREGTRPTTDTERQASSPMPSVSQVGVGRVPSRGAGTRPKLPKRLRRLDAVWIGKGVPCFFLTICVQGRAKLLAKDEVHTRLRQFLQASPRDYGWWPSCYVIMPDHIHLLVRQGEPPRGGTCSEASERGAQPTTLGEWVKALKAVVGGHAVKWQRGFFDHVLRSEESEAEKWEYIRQNPVRADLVSRAKEWTYAGEITYEDVKTPRQAG